MCKIPVRMKHNDCKALGLVGAQLKSVIVPVVMTWDWNQEDTHFQTVI